jgi:hypothetical protein
LDLGVVPKTKAMAAHQGPNHLLQPLHPVPIDMAVADEQLMAFWGWGHRKPPGERRSGRMDSGGEVKAPGKDN